MISSREDFLMTVLGCGVLDLSLIDGVKFDWEDVLDGFDFTEKPSLSRVMCEVFVFAKSQMAKAIDERRDYLEDTKGVYGISQEQQMELDALNLLDPYDDLEEFHNFIDTHVTCINNQDIYRKYLQEELNSFAENTGFEIEFDE